MQKQNIVVPGYREARKKGEVTHQDGYHQPGSGHRGRPLCGCSLDTEKGAYRDVTVKMPDGRVAHFYHQSPVVVVQDGRYRLDNHGYTTRSTKERINGHTPSGYKVFQRGYEWYVKVWDPETPFRERDPDEMNFKNGMMLEP